MKTLTLLTWITAFQALIGVFVKLTDSRGPVQTFTAQAMAFNPALFFVVRADIRRHGMIDGGRNRLQQETWA